MFKNDEIRPEPTPMRVWKLCSIVNNMSDDPEYIRGLMEPNKSDEASYFPHIKKVAIELGLIKEDKNKIIFIGDNKDIESIDSFRLYCNSIVWKNDNSLFYKIAVMFAESSSDFLKYDGMTNGSIISKMESNYGVVINNIQILGARFWFSFLGFGYIYEPSSSPKTFLPCSYRMVLDLIKICGFEKNKEMSFTDFMSSLNKYTNKLFERSKKEINTCLWFALDMMQNQEVISLKEMLDMDDKWKIPSENKYITHITIKG